MEARVEDKYPSHKWMPESKMDSRVKNGRPSLKMDAHVENGSPSQKWMRELKLDA